MSITLMTMISRSTGLTSSEKSVASALADNANDDGAQIRPSVAIIARKTELDECQIQEVLGTLVNKGVIAVQCYEDTAMKNPSRYRFLLAESGHLAYTGGGATLDEQDAHPSSFNQTELPEDGNFVVYRHYDATNILLYVGYSSRVRTRMKQHERSPWWGFIARCFTEVFESRFEAMRAETLAIRNELPLWNIQGQPCR